MLALSTVTLVSSFLALFFLAIVVAKLVNVVRSYQVRIACYRRMGVPSLTHAVKARAIARYQTF